MALQAHDHDRAADLLRRTQVSVRDAEGHITGPGAVPRHGRRRQQHVPAAPSRLREIVDLLDDNLRDTPLVDDAGEAGPRCLAAERATTLIAGVEALVAPELRR